MPNTTQAAKRMRQNVKQRLANRARKTAIKTYTKKVTAAIADKNGNAADEAFILVQARLDKAAKNRTVHPNKAARRKSRLQKQINAMKAAQS